MHILALFWPLIQEYEFELDLYIFLWTSHDIEINIRGRFFNTELILFQLRLTKFLLKEAKTDQMGIREKLVCVCWTELDLLIGLTVGSKVKP